MNTDYTERKKRIKVFLKSQEAWLNSTCPSVSSANEWILVTTYNLYTLGIKKIKIFIPDYDQDFFLMSLDDYTFLKSVIFARSYMNRTAFKTWQYFL